VRDHAIIAMVLGMLANLVNPEGMTAGDIYIYLYIFINRLSRLIYRLSLLLSYSTCDLMQGPFHEGSHVARP
jgi:hypothetical protein